MVSVFTMSSSAADTRNPRLEFSRIEIAAIYIHSTSANPNTRLPTSVKLPKRLAAWKSLGARTIAKPHLQQLGMSQTSGAPWSKPPVDDEANIQRFLDAMVRKNLTAFTNSKPMPVRAKQVDEQSSSAANNSDNNTTLLSGSHVANGSITQAKTESSMQIVTMQDKVVDEKQKPPPLAETKAIGLSTPRSPLSPTQSDELKALKNITTAPTLHKQAQTQPNTARSITNKFLTSPLTQGVRAPPPTPDAAPTANVKKIIVDAFGDLKVGFLPDFALVASTHAPPSMTVKEQNRENTRPGATENDMPRFFSPSKILSPEEKQQRDESFHRILALSSPNVPILKENKVAQPNLSWGNAENGKGVLASRWADNHGGAFERRNSGSAAIPIVDPETKARTSPASSAASVLPSPPVFAETKLQGIHESAPAARSLSITATLTVTTPSAITKSSTLHSRYANPWPASNHQSAASSTTASDARGSDTAAAPMTNSAFKVFDTKSDPNETNLFFSSWPKLAERDVPRTQPPISSALRKRLADLKILAARIRRVEIVNIPHDSSPTFVQSLVFGGPLELLTVGSTSARVVFQHPEDCIKFYDATSNGLVYTQPGGKEEVCFVELAKDVDVVGGMLRGYIDQGTTRCVRSIGVDEDWGMPALYKMAGRKGRKVEKIIDGVSVGGVSRSLVLLIKFSLA